MARIDIVVTWPKTRPLQSYLDELERAERDLLVINYRVARPPRWKDLNALEREPRCYMVHDGFIRGYNEIRYVTEWGEGVVSRTSYDEDGMGAWAGFWPAGWYVVRDPHWYPVEPVPMRGFQGWRWYGKEG